MGCDVCVSVCECVCGGSEVKGRAGLGAWDEHQSAAEVDLCCRNPLERMRRKGGGKTCKRRTTRTKLMATYATRKRISARTSAPNYLVSNVSIYCGLDRYLLHGCTDGPTAGSGEG